MAKTKYKIDQFLRAGAFAGAVTEVRIKKDQTTYIIGEHQDEVSEDAVTAVYRRLSSRGSASGKSKVSQAHTESCGVTS